MSVNSYEDLAYHVGHDIVIDAWGGSKLDPANVSVTCNTCNEILFDFDRETMF